jgi:uncharacterized protein (TIGR02217 family)
MTDGTFHEVLFPIDISYGSSGGPMFKTVVFTSDSGYEQRNINWQQTRAQYNVSQGIKTQAQMDVLTDFFFARQGRAFGFRFQDWNDYQLTNQQIALGDGYDTSFQIIKTYTSAQAESGQSFTFTRNITKIDWSTVTGVTIGVAQIPPNEYQVDETTGIITFASPPPEDAAIVIGSAQFHVPVRFDTDHLDTTQEFWMTQSWPNIPLVEVRDWEDLGI